MMKLAVSGEQTSFAGGRQQGSGLSLLAALGALSLPSVLTGCGESPSPQTTQREQALAPHDPHTTAQAIRQIGRDLQKTYEAQNASGPISVDAALGEINRVYQQCAELLPNERRGALSPEAQAGDFSQQMARDSLARVLIDSGVFLNAGVKKSDQADRVYVTAEILLLDAEFVTYHAPQFEVGGLKLPLVDEVRIRNVREEVLPHYENAPGNRLTGEAFVLPGQYVPSIDTVLLNPAAIRLFSARTEKSVERVQDLVILNELAHASFERLVANVSEPEQLVLDLSMPGGESLSLDLHHLSEAFSDYVSLRYGTDVVGFLEERGTVSVEDYQLSSFLLRNGLAAVLRADPPLVPVDQLKLETFEASARATAAYLKKNPTREDPVRIAIADTYEQGLSRLIQFVLEQP